MTFKKFYGLLLVFLMGLLIFADYVDAKPKGKLIWDPAKIQKNVVIGKSRYLSAIFVSTTELNDLYLDIVPELESFVSVEPNFFAIVEEGVEYEVSVHISAPDDAFIGIYDGTIHPRVGSRTYPQTLKFELNFIEPIGAEGGTVVSPDNTQITLFQNAVDYRVDLFAEQISTTAITAPINAFEVVGAVQVTFEPSDFAGDTPPPAVPLEISIPAPTGVPEGSEFIFAQQVLIDTINVPEPGLLNQLIPVDIGSVVDGNIITQSNVFQGVLGGGLYAIIPLSGSGFATGIVSDASGPRAGVVVSNDTNTLVALTDASGRYTLFISGGPFTVTGFDPLRGSSGSGSGNIIVSGDTVTANFSLTPLTISPLTRDGIRNSGFERCDLSSWTIAGSGVATQQFGPTSTGVVIDPTEGQCMADINTGTGAIGEVGSSITQRFRVPAGVSTLRFDFNFVSEEFPEWVGSIYNDMFRAVITTPNGESTFAQVSVNQSGGYTLIGDCFFPGGDSTCGQTGWREGSVDLTAFSGTGTVIEVTLLFSAIDSGDDIYDTHVLIDNIRFSTIWIDAKIINGSNADEARVQQEVQDANEVLSQGGINVRLRNVQTINDPGNLLDTDATWTIDPTTTRGIITAEESQLIALNRSTTATDFNIYYVRSLTGSGGLAIAVGPDDFDMTSALVETGIIMTDNVFPETMAHEMGHILISPDRAGSTLEHNVGTTTNIMHVPRTAVRNAVNRQQSANINRAGAPHLVP